MIVRDEAAVVAETLESVAPHIDRWVIVDTGSTDDTIAVIESFFADRGIPGEIHEREWVSFGVNRSQALELARGKADYTLVVDADDLLVGSPDFTELSVDGYHLRIGSDFTYWRTQVFRSDLPWRYEGAVHEYPMCETTVELVRLEGDYHIESRRLGARSQVEDKYLRDAAALLSAHDDDPHDPRTVFYLGQSYMDAGDPEEGLAWYGRRIEMGGWDEERFIAMLRAGQCVERMDGPWDDALGHYLTAHQFRPSRAEPLHEISRHYREIGEFPLGYVFAKRAADIPLPESDMLFVGADVYEWKAADELSIAAYYTGRLSESFELSNGLLVEDCVPETDRSRVVQNRDFSVPHVAAETAAYPAEVVARILQGARGDLADVTLTITTCRRPDLFETTINSFLNCCTDLDRVGRWICIDDRSAGIDRERMQVLYPFFEFIWKPDADAGHHRSMNMALDLLDGRYWLHLEDDWHFFAPGPYISWAEAVLADEPNVAQVLFNVNYGETLEGQQIAGGEVHRATNSCPRYRLHEYHPHGSEELQKMMAALAPGKGTNAWWPHFSLRPSMLDVTTIRDLGRFDESADHFELEFAERYAAAGLKSAFFDTICCLHTGRLTGERDAPDALNAYSLNQQAQFSGKAEAATPPPVESEDHVVGLVGEPPGELLEGSRWGNAVFTRDLDRAEFLAVFEGASHATNLPKSVLFGSAAAKTDTRSCLQARTSERFPPPLLWSTPRSSDHKTARLAGFGVGPGLADALAAAGVAPDCDDATAARYAIVIDDEAEPNSFSEHVVRAVAAGTLCFYSGCPNLSDYIDPRAYVALPPDVGPAEWAAIVRHHVSVGAWQESEPMILAEGRRLALDLHLLPTVARAINGASFIDRIVIDVVNLDRRPDRWAHLTAHFSEVAGGDFFRRCRRVAAIDGQSLEMTPEIRHLFRDNDFNYRSALVATALTHIGLWQGIAEGSAPAGLIFEDDVELCTDFPSQLVEFCGLLVERHRRFDVGLLGWFPWPAHAEGHSMRSQRSVTVEPVPWDRYMGGAFAYLLSKSGAARLLRILERDGCQVGIDWFLMRKAEELNAVIAAAPIADSTYSIPGESGDSDIQHDFREL